MPSSCACKRTEGSQRGPCSGSESMGSWALQPCPLAHGFLTVESPGLGSYEHTSSPLLLQDLGITKVGHMKRILQAIKELSNPP